MRPTPLTLRFLIPTVLSCWIVASQSTHCRAVGFADVVAESQPKMVKIYGAGGLRSLESYQSGFLISADGYLLTAWSYVLDTDEILVTLNDGRKFVAQLMGLDPRIEIALLKIQADDLPHYPLDSAIELSLGDRVLAFSNLYGVATGNEPASVQHGTVTAVTQLDARRGTYRTPYRGRIYVLDAMTNNAGAAGGALTDRHGRLAGILGKELRDTRTGIWLNYALPIAEIGPSVEKLLSGEVPNAGPDEDLVAAENPWTLEDLGLRLVPDVLPKTPAYIDTVTPDSLAARAGLLADDLILYVNQRLIRSIKAARQELSILDRDESITLIVQRGQELLSIVIEAQ